jgi:hypothetical protein
MQNPGLVVGPYPSSVRQQERRVNHDGTGPRPDSQGYSAAAWWTWPRATRRGFGGSLRSGS